VPFLVNRQEFMIVLRIRTTNENWRNRRFDRFQPPIKQQCFFFVFVVQRNAVEPVQNHQKTKSLKLRKFQHFERKNIFAIKNNFDNDKN
jgi:hypothetical protein